MSKKLNDYVPTESMLAVTAGIDNLIADKERDRIETMNKVIMTTFKSMYNGVPAGYQDTIKEEMYNMLYNAFQLGYSNGVAMQSGQMLEVDNSIQLDSMIKSFFTNDS
jgi:hypothetical protein